MIEREGFSTVRWFKPIVCNCESLLRWYVLRSVSLVWLFKKWEKRLKTWSWICLRGCCGWKRGLWFLISGQLLRSWQDFMITALFYVRGIFWFRRLHFLMIKISLFKIPVVLLRIKVTFLYLADFLKSRRNFSRSQRRFLSRWGFLLDPFFIFHSSNFCYFRLGSS